MANWLVKSEPKCWSWEDHAKAGADAWTGVRNHQAKSLMKAMTKGDRVLFYHSGDDKAVVGTSEVVRDAYLDPTDPGGAFFAVDLRSVAALARPVSLAEIKAQPALEEMVLVKNSRLSVQPVSDAEWDAIQRLADG